MDLIDVHSTIQFDDSISMMELHAHQPFNATTFGANDEIRIAVNNQDILIHPHKSYLHFSGRLCKADNTNHERIHFIRNCIMHLFKYIVYELNGIEIDRSVNVGITSTMMGYLCFRKSDETKLQNMSWKEDYAPGENGGMYYDSKGLKCF